MRTFLQLHRKQVQLLHSFLQLVLGRSRHGVDIVITSVVVFVRVCGEDLQTGQRSKVRRPDSGVLSVLYAVTIRLLVPSLLRPPASDPEINFSHHLNGQAGQCGENIISSQIKEQLT